MNFEQQRVVNHVKGPAAVLAGAGSGKTYTLIGRIEQLSKITDPKRIVMLTFTNAAADEMKYRASKVNDACKEVIACTYHKYCGKMLRKYGKAIGIEPSFEVLTGMKYRTLIEYVKSANDYYEGLKDFPSASKLDTIFSTVINNDDATIESLIYGTKYQKYAVEIKNLYAEVKKYGLDNQKLNFDDMLVYMNQLLDNKDICEKIANTFDYLMVDEFQDTNTLQLNILLKLSRYNRNIVIVGDISQSIYKFRGAKVTNIRDFIDTFDDCDVYTLSINYRSTQEIIDSVNDIMNNHVRSWSYTNMVSNNKHGELPVLIKNADSNSQAHWIIQQIKHYVEEEYYDLSQIAIIERKSMSSFKLENELLKAKIPFEKRGGLKLTDYVCVDDILSFFSILVKNDKFSWFNVLKLIPGIGTKTATNIADHCTEEKFLDAYNKKKYSIHLVELMNNLNDFSNYTKNLDTLFDKVVDYYVDLRTFKINNSKMSSSAKFDAREKIEKDKEILNVFKDMSTSYNSLKAFLEDIALDSIKTESTSDDRLMITTIHSAKGLEWPVVIIIDCVENDSKDNEEELRCLYVAMTRAETQLTLSIPELAVMNGQVVYNEFIHFIHSSTHKFRKGKE